MAGYYMWFMQKVPAQTISSKIILVMHNTVR